MIWVIFNVKELNPHSFKDYPRIRKHIEIKILISATKNPINDPIKISLSLIVIFCNFCISNLLSIFFLPIFRAAEYVTLQISHFGISITSLFYILRAIQSKIQS